MGARELVADAARRPVEAAEAAVEGVSAEVLNRMPDGTHNSMSWLLWHAARQQDAQIAQLCGAEQIWTAEGWSDSFGLDRAVGDFGFGDGPEQVAGVRVEDPGLLVGYLRAVCCATAQYVGSLDDAALDEVVDESWDPPVTRGMRIVSTIDDATQHVGQAAYVRGLVSDWSGRY
ncbi:DUF664 domain-containing protein [Kocuria rhizophila]|uniref:mycothiol transferase n=1 Tax=Kocuria rhizophila TaxID=72000 RepID=UPI001E0EC269|nr:DUF664 domain-containing protein [Kocuria rhizophila]MCC5672621.1 DUF664 domain-containing protein [Kocuria rhizophila]MCC5674739.1 DUF664 domain-containing protein [Kocuria rhizophila]MDV6000052.1 DUF664 domain-containing protein [Kocuria rhizophila]